MDNILVIDGGNENRTSRMSVLAWHRKDGKVCNLFHPHPPPTRRRDGPVGR